MDFETIQQEFEQQIQEIMKVENKTREEVMKELESIESIDDIISKGDK